MISSHFNQMRSGILIALYLSILLLCCMFPAGADNNQPPLLSLENSYGNVPLSAFATSPSTQSMAAARVVEISRGQYSVDLLV